MISYHGKRVSEKLLEIMSSLLLRTKRAAPFWLGGSCLFLAYVSSVLSVPSLVRCQPNFKKVLKNENPTNDDNKSEAGKCSIHGFMVVRL